MNKISQYLKASRAELVKVVWPSRRETVKYTIEVIVISFGVAAFLGIIDWILNTILGFFI